MQKILSVTGGILTFISIYHIYLNFYFPEIYSFEESLKTIRSSFINQPIKSTIFSAAILVLSLIISVVINKVYSIYSKNFFKKSESVEEQKNRIEKAHKLRDEFNSRMIKKFNSVKEIPLEPYYKIRPEYSEVIILNIRETGYPEKGNWFKYEVFDIKDNGIELLSSNNITGFDLYKNDKGQWDVILNNNYEKLQNGNYKKPSNAFSIDFISYEDIVYVDWKTEGYYNCISIHCNYKYKSHIEHPVREIRYYCITPVGPMRFDSSDRRNFKKLRPHTPIVKAVDKVKLKIQRYQNEKRRKEYERTGK